VIELNIITHIFIISLLSIFFFCILYFSTKKNCYWGAPLRTDNEKMVLAASKINLFDWPSKMHAINFNRSQQREYWAIFLRLILKFLNKKDLSDFNNILLALISNFFSPILIYFIISNYFNPNIGFLISLVYVTSLWSHYISIYIGHILLSQTFFLISILLIQTSFHSSFSSYENLLIFFAGFCTGVSYFSSSASRKYVYLIFIALFIEHSQIIEFDFFLENIKLDKDIYFFLFIFYGCIFFLKKKINSYFKEYTDTILSLINLFLIIIILKFLFFQTNYLFINSLFFLFFGFFITMIHIFFPKKDFILNLKKHISWLNVTEWASHFRAYDKDDQMRIFKHIIPSNFRGGGLIWIHKILLLYIPIIYLIYIFAIGFIICKLLINLDIDNLLSLILIFLLSIFPIFIHEFTKGLKVAKAYFSVLPTMLILISYSLNIILKETEVIYFVVIASIFLQFIFTIFTLFSDSIPCRTSANKIANYLIKKKINKIYTYDNAYNDAFIKAIMNIFPNDFKVEYVSSIKKLRDKIILIPNTSSKSLFMESEKYAIKNGDFDEDEYLNSLIDDKFQNVQVLRKFKTMGSSKYFVNESEVTSYRNIILKQISDYDRFRGHAWLIKLNS